MSAKLTHEQKHRALAEIHASNVERIHNVMKRAMDTIVATDTKALQGDTLVRFMVFVKAFSTFLHSHHDHEEEIFFPDAVAKEPERMKPVVETLEAEHKQLIAQINRLVELSNNPLTATVEAATEAKETVAAFKDSLCTHFDVEVKEMDANHYEKFYTDSEMQKQTNRAASAARRHTDPTLTMPLMLFNMSVEERKVFVPHLPWFVRTFLLPMFIKKYSAVWEEYCAFPTKDARGRLSVATAA